MGEDYPLQLRLGACDYMEGGNTVEDGAAAAKIFEETGIDILDISGGICGTQVKGHEKEQGYFWESSEEVKKALAE